MGLDLGRSDGEVGDAFRVMKEALNAMMDATGVTGRGWRSMGSCRTTSTSRCRSTPRRSPRSSTGCAGPPSRWARTRSRWSGSTTRSTNSTSGAVLQALGEQSIEGTGADAADFDYTKFWTEEYAPDGPFSKQVADQKERHAQEEAAEETEINKRMEGQDR